MNVIIDCAAISLVTIGGGRVTLSGAVIETFASGLRGRLCLPSDAGFDEARRLFNGICDKRPGMIVECLGVSDVIKSVNLAREYGLLVSVRGGGHHMSGFASNDGGLVIDLSRMKSVRIDPANRTARAEPGCTLFDLDTECQAFGLAVPSGVVSNTGIAGLSLGGGLGWLMRSCGLTIDNILAFDVVTPDGVLRKANAEEHPDLYWALRGGGGNFGVVTSFEYRLHPVEGVTAGWIHYPLESARELMRFYREFLIKSPDLLVVDAGFWVLPGGVKVCSVAVCYNGPEEEAAKAIEPLWQMGMPPIANDVRRMSYLELQSMTDEGPLPGMRYHQKDRFFAAVTDELIDAMAANFAAVPVGEGSDDTLRVVGAFRYLGGAVARVAADETPFPHRDTRFVFEVTSMWDEAKHDADNIAWTEKLYADLAPFAIHGHYINGHMETGEDPAREIYSRECYERLVAIKNKYDPGNMMRNNYNIKPTRH